MPRGSKPGERRGGRQKGTPNKRTAFNNAVAAAAAADPDILPLDLFRNVMRNSDLPLDTRIMAAQSALPYVHAKPSGRGQRPEPGASRVKLRPVRPVADDQGIAPLDFLLQVMRDLETPSHTRIRVGLIVAPYIHRKVEPRPPTLGDHEVDDEYGFVVDWEKAKALRDLQDTETRLSDIWHLRGARGDLLQQRRDLFVAIAEATKGLVCGPGYRWADRYKDRKRFSALDQKRRAARGEKTGAQGEWTVEEETEEIYLAARIASHDNSEEGIAARELYRAWYLKADPYKAFEKRPGDEEWRKIGGDFESIPYGPNGPTYPLTEDIDPDYALAEAAWFQKTGWAIGNTRCSRTSRRSRRGKGGARLTIKGRPRNIRD